MKQSLGKIIGAWMFVILATACFGQTPTTTPTVQNPITLSDPTMSSRLQTDLAGRTAQLGNQPVSWYDNGNGYYGTYTIGNENYMVWYDKQGTYVDTMTKMSWNSPDVPANLKASFDKSPYKSQPVTGYWTISDPVDTRGYYLEIQDNNGKVQRVWSDETGKFTTSPPKMKVNDKSKY
jgi:hypothetical protein